MNDMWPTLWVFVLASFIGMGVIRKVSRLLHTPLMSLTNAISAIAVVGSILVTGGDYPLRIRILGAIALFASMTNIVSGFLITDRMLKMFKTDTKQARAAATHDVRRLAGRIHRRLVAVHPRPALDEHAGHGAQRRLCRRRRHGHRGAHDVGRSVGHSSRVDHHRHRGRVRRRHPAVARAADGCAAADGAVACVRRHRGGSRRHREALPAAGKAPSG